ncbi:hypothetical protein MGYG_01830 [Nannizzia gypsea CBS 118893]|uniref:Protein kinase domain-containing protein n=1 Tax=Arthroderma gypseum (strain ATCC MYA-4604 / CBS 118893) TaxID=535722 RepID=E5R3W9_ARTGP|nr:hypothetical protein MGYG_01830 [Nannizzia gypsea CBS 118893]EFQ98815.1 hypothetical protein MGYG_01830 [Nannizzia gypsea CBS 118893]
MASDNAPDFEALYKREKEQRLQAEERASRAEEQQRQADERAAQEREQRLQAEERNQRISFEEFIQACHYLLSLPTKVQESALSTKGSIGKPTGKLCPTYLRPWLAYSGIQEEFYTRVCGYFEPTDRLFPPIIALEDIARRCYRPLSSEKDVEFYERLAVEQHVQDVIAELCKSLDARNDFALGEGVTFENHANIIDEGDEDEDEDNAGLPNQPNARHAIPDQFCIHRVDDGVHKLLTTVEYKPPHKLPIEYLHAGLREMNLWKEVVQRDTSELKGDDKLRYNAEQITASTLVQEFHVMINEGLEFSYVTNGLVYVMLHVRRGDPNTLYYHLCNPNTEVNQGDTQILSKTAIARVLCLCLMSCSSQPRDQNWRNLARQQLHEWETSPEYERARIPEEELRQTPPGSEHVPSSSPLSSPTADNHRPITRSRAGCAPQSTTAHPSETADSDSDSQQAAPGRKRNLSELTASPPGRRRSRQREGQRDGIGDQGGYKHTAVFCTQKCLLGLQRGDALDSGCPNVEKHRSTDGGDKHPINAARLVVLIKQQLDEDLDRDCTPFGICGSYGAPFKITCRQYGYTIVGKGTTRRRWGEVRREAEVYRVLQKVQGSAVPVFLGCIDMKMIYHLHGAGCIQHMLLMGWGGEDTSRMKQTRELHDEIERSKKQIRAIGVHHQDLRPNNLLWNAELKRALIIDFHRSRLIAPIRNRKSAKRSAAASGLEDKEQKKIGKLARIIC